MDSHLSRIPENFVRSSSQNFSLFTLSSSLILKKSIMEEIQAIKPGPKPRKDDGSLDKRRRVTPEKKEKYPPLKPHKHKPND
ncbi:hypothetical protein [Pontibacter diazotrophicus]|nr:hypothetical protein [Pontibacter diazotrophicus]